MCVAEGGSLAQESIKAMEGIAADMEGPRTAQVARAELVLVAFAVSPSVKEHTSKATPLIQVDNTPQVDLCG